MPLTDKERDDLLNKISRKIELSPALNGGFDKLVGSVNTIKEKQERQDEKLDKLYDPEEGLFSRVQQVENDLRSVDTKISNYNSSTIEKFDKIEKQLDKIESINKTVSETANVTKRLQRIAGEDLQDLNKTIELQKQFAKLFWGIVALAFTGLGNLIWQIVTRK